MRQRLHQLQAMPLQTKNEFYAYSSPCNNYKFGKETSSSTCEAISSARRSYTRVHSRGRFRPHHPIK